MVEEIQKMSTARRRGVGRMGRDGRRENAAGQCQLGVKKGRR
jgi:hypothetical protein